MFQSPTRFVVLHTTAHHDGSLGPTPWSTGIVQRQGRTLEEVVTSALAMVENDYRKAERLADDTKCTVYLTNLIVADNELPPASSTYEQPPVAGFSQADIAFLTNQVASLAKLKQYLSPSDAAQLGAVISAMERKIVEILGVIGNDNMR